MSYILVLFVFEKKEKNMKTEMEQIIAKAFYDVGWRKSDLLKRFSLRPKTLEDILARHKSEFVKEEKT